MSLFWNRIVFKSGLYSNQASIFLNECIRGAKVILVSNPLQHALFLGMPKAYAVFLDHRRFHK